MLGRTLLITFVLFCDYNANMYGSVIKNSVELDRIKNNDYGTNKSLSTQLINYNRKTNSSLIATRSTSGSALQEEGRKKKNQQDLMSRILPMMIIPFMVQSSIVPFLLASLKMMLMKSMFIGKMAILLVVLNALRRSTNNEGGVFSHNIQVDHGHLAENHYGYTGGTEYGAYINRRKRKSR